MKDITEYDDISRVSRASQFLLNSSVQAWWYLHLYSI